MTRVLRPLIVLIFGNTALSQSLTHDVTVDERVGDAPHEGHGVEDGDVVDEGGSPAADATGGGGREAEEEEERLEEAVGGEGGHARRPRGGGGRGDGQVRGEPAADEAAQAQDAEDEGQVVRAETLHDGALQSHFFY